MAVIHVNAVRMQHADNKLLHWTDCWSSFCLFCSWFI